MTDPDAALATTDAVRKLRVQITHLEEQLNLGTGGASAELRRLRNNRAYYNGLLADGGTEAQRQQFDRLWEQLEQYEAADDARGIKWVGEQMNSVHHFLVTDRASWWHDWLDALARPDRKFVNRDEADKAIAEARAARTGGDLAALRAAVRKLWQMEPADHLRDADDRAAASGVRSP